MTKERFCETCYVNVVNDQCGFCGVSVPCATEGCLWNVDPMTAFCVECSNGVIVQEEDQTNVILLQ